MIAETFQIDRVVNCVEPGQLKARFNAARPHRFFAIDNFLQREFAERIVAEYPTFEEAQKLGQEFKAVNERLKVQITDSRKFPPPVLRLHEALASPEFLGVLSYITGIPDILPDPTMAGGGMHQTGPSGHLDVHVDFNRLKDPPLFRRLNIIVYLNRGWQPEWGGNFELWDKDVKQVQQSFEPFFNRCVLFETTDESFHGVSAVRCPPCETRKSFAAYYYTVEAPPYYSGVDHGTMFRARPDEYFKGKVLMPLEDVRRWTRASLSQLKRKLKA